MSKIQTSNRDADSTPIGVHISNENENENERHGTDSDKLDKCDFHNGYDQNEDKTPFKGNRISWRFYEYYFD